MNGVAYSVAIPCDAIVCGLGNTSVFDYSISDFYSSGENLDCVQPRDVSEVALKEGGNDGWLVASVYTNFISCGSVGLHTADKASNKWIDGNQDASHLCQTLTFA